MKSISLLASMVGILGLPVLAFAQGNDANGIEFFEAKIRPVLSKHCYECHSAQAKKLKADLSLDSRAGLLKGGDSGPALVPGKAKDSLIIKALLHDGSTKMPSQAVKLPKEVIDDFVKWIDMGAPDPRDGKVVSKKKTYDIDKERDYWAFRPIGDVAPPMVKNAAWAKTPIDRFVLAKLEEKGLAPNGPINAERLLRRATFDLTGLPPTPADLAALDGDARAKPQTTYEKAIDEQMASPRFGERWARHWLDTVRFAESGGYEFDGNRPAAYHYRDFVIEAMNDDMPFDQFLRWQIAGDQIVPGDLTAIAATGFLVAGSYPGQTTSKTLALIRYDHLDDMISTLGTSMLGLSLGCARCHEHKYDPIPQEDYYHLVAALGRTDSANLKVNTDPTGFKKAKAEFDAAHAPLLKVRDEFEKNELPKFLQSYWKANKDRTAPTWLTVEPVEVKGAGPTTIAVKTMQQKIKALRLEIAAEKLPAGKDGFTLTEITAVASNNAVKKTNVAVKLKAGQNLVLKDRVGVFELENEIGFDGGTNLSITLKYKSESPRKLIVGLTTIAPAEADAAAEPQAATELVTIRSEWKVELRDAIVRWSRQLNPAAEKIYGAVERHAKDEPKPNLIDVFAAQSGRGGPVNFLIRGEPEKKRELVNPGFAQVLMIASVKEQKWLDPKVDPRVALANWLTDTKDGAGNLVARVIVNRLWQHHMGKGLVATPNDFGVQGEPPTHPELLDYLAGELISNGWRLKPIHKLIMTSAVYMQSNAINEQAVKIDPANKLWWRHPTRRLEAEAIRDSLLAVGGTLDLKMYGVGTLDQNSPRRSVYLTVKRSQMIPFLQMFDMPEPLQGIGERSVTTVPTQSLAFMNSPLVRGAAQKLAIRVKAKTDAESIEEAYRIALSRRPTNAERNRMESFIANYGTQARDQALVDFCQLLLCLNEFIYVD